MSNLQPNCCLEFDFQKVEQHAGGKWLIHDTKRRKDNQLQVFWRLQYIARFDVPSVLIASRTVFLQFLLQTF